MYNVRWLTIGGNMNNITQIEQLMKEISFIHFKRMYPMIKKIGLYPGQEFFLRCIIENNGLTQRELANLTRRESATITKAIQRLENSGYIKRKVDSHDKRRTHIYITDLGVQTYKQVESFHKNESEAFQKILTEEDVEHFLAILKKIKQGLEKGEVSNEKNI